MDAKQNGAVRPMHSFFHVEGQANAAYILLLMQKGILISDVDSGMKPVNCRSSLGPVHLFRFSLQPKTHRYKKEKRENLSLVI